MECINYTFFYSSCFILVLTEFGIPSDRIPKECRKRHDISGDNFGVKLYYAGRCITCLSAVHFLNCENIMSFKDNGETMAR